MLAIIIIEKRGYKFDRKVEMGVYLYQRMEREGKI